MNYLLNRRKNLLVLCFCLLVTVANAQKKTTGKSKPPAPVHTSGTVVKKSAVKDTLVEITTSHGVILVRLYKETPLHRSNFIKLASSGFYDSLLFHRVIKDFMIQGGDPTSRNADSAAMLGSGENGYRIPAEFNKLYFHKKGALAAARDNNPEKASSGCQFYLVQGKKWTTQELNGMVNGINYNNKMIMLQEYTNRDSVKARLEDYNMRGDQAGLEKYMKEIKADLDKQFEPLMYTMNTMQIAEYMQNGGTPHLDGSYTVFGEMLTGFDVLDKIAAEKTYTMNRPVKDMRMKMKIVIQ